MKKILLFAFIACSTIASAKINPQTIGMKLGGGNWFTFEFAYQHPMSQNNRMEFALGILSGGYCPQTNWDHGHWKNDRYYYDHNHGTGVSMSAAYHWIIPIEAGFNWYIGPSVRLGAKNESLLLGIAPQGGVEYNFNNIPLQLCVDMRTGLGINRDAFFLWDLMMGVRYAF